MTRGEHLTWWHVVVAYPCPTCNAAPGVMCFTATGENKHEPHAARSRLAAEHHWENPDD